MRLVRLVPILAQIKNSVERGEYIRQWAMKINIREEELLRMSVNIVVITKLAGRMPVQLLVIAPADRAIADVVKSGHVEAEQQLLAFYLTSRDDYDRVTAAMTDEQLFSAVSNHQGSH